MLVRGPAMQAVAKAADLPGQKAVAVRAMIVDDSTVVRSLIRRWLVEAGIQVVASANRGSQAVDEANRTAPDVVILDIEMPDMDGLTALPLVLKARPGVAVIMVSSLTRRNAEISLKCLAMGAADCLPKPNMMMGDDALGDFKRELVAKVMALGKRRLGAAGSEHGKTALRKILTPAPETSQLRAFSRARPKVLAIGSSTGGPQALADIFKGLRGRAPGVPVLITQHMPANFTAVLAEHLGNSSGLPATEGAQDMPIKADRIYVAPGGRHMEVGGTPAEPFIRITDAPPVNYCRPAVDPLFASAAAVFGPAVLAVVLTGMGQDGARGALDIAQAGGSVIAQDEASSVVWGMPGFTVKLGACAAVLPINEIASKITNVLSGSVS